MLNTKGKNGLVDNMKHLKPHFIFESIEKKDYNLLEDIRDILLPFSDMGIQVSCDYTNNDQSIEILIMTTKEKAFDANEYKEDINRVLFYLKENDWGIFNFNLGVVEVVGDQKLVSKNQQILSHKNGPLLWDKVKNPIAWIRAEFVKLVYTKVKSIKK